MSIEGHAANAAPNDSWENRYSHALMNTFGAPQRVLNRGEGCYVWDTTGQRYLDCLAGIAVNALGHAHPAIVEALTTQVSTLGHTSNFFATPPQITLAETLLRLSQAPEGSRVFFTNSGTEAVEAAFKMARLHGRTLGEGSTRCEGGTLGDPGTQRDGGTHREGARILALEGSFHGRTLGSLSLTAKAAYREPFEPLPGGVEFVPLASAEDPFAALSNAFAADAVRERGPVAALILEPLQGEAGVVPLPAGYLAHARSLTQEANALLIADEVQTGVGRTGAWFAHQEVDGGIVPDVMTLAKGLGGGFPIGAVVAFGSHTASLLQPGLHGTTFGGNPLACASALAVLNTTESDNLLPHVQGVGQTLRDTLMAEPSPVLGIRGRGLLLGVMLPETVAAADVQRAALERGLIVNAVAPHAIRLAPPLILTEEQARDAATILRDAITEVAAPSSQEITTTP
ncbi:MAG: acetylornithine transaminase [Cellulomonadaceae bacterium]|jgi:acetylornithine aminotransferase|nr:acetylornithine transaminase [Cellulomonadaceae bacterium]